MIILSNGSRIGGVRPSVVPMGLRMIVCVGLLLSAGTALAAPNDDCQSAVMIVEGTPAVEGNNSTADEADTLEASCAESDYDVWYAYVASCTGTATINTTGSQQDDTTLAVYDSCGGSELACNDDSGNLLSQVSIAVQSGSTYLVRLASVGLPGDFDLNIVCDDVPANDTCDTALLIVDGSMAASGDNSGASDVDDDEASCRESDSDVWFLYEAECTGGARVDSAGSQQADTVLTVYDACGGNELDCSDDKDGLLARLFFDVVEGDSYWIRLASVGSAGGYGLSVTCEPIPLNQDCVGATFVTDGSPAAQGDNSGAVAPDDAEASCRASDRDVWFTYQATCTGAAIIDTTGSGQSDPVLSVYDSCGGDELVCSDDAGGLQAEVMLPVVQGDEYLIRLATIGDPGDYDLNIACFEVPANDACVNAIQIAEGIPAATGQNIGAILVDDGVVSCRESSNDVWFEYVATCDGSAIIDTVGSSMNDTVLSVYDGCGGNELACDDDTGGTFSQVFLQVTAGQSYWIRIASVGEPGDYVLNITVPTTFAPAADDALDVVDSSALCSSDDQCLNESVCINGRCYVPKHRYLSVKASPSNIAFETARRVQIEVADGVYQTLGYVGPSTLIAAGGSGDSERLVAALQDEPYYTSWSFLADDTIEVSGCAIVPGYRYSIQTINCGAPTDVESSYSERLILPTVEVYGDCCGGEMISTPPDGVANFVDIQSGVACFMQTGTQLPRTWCDVDPVGSSANQLIVNFADVLVLVNGLQQEDYPQDPFDCSN